jgi:phospholipid/cholesterol/gamma-HCH transport system substrate-binding protein
VKIRTVINAAAAVAIIAIAVVLLSGGGNDYVIGLEMHDALGLRDGSKVVEGGVQVGTVHVRLGAHDQVVATLAIQRQFAPVGRDASAQVVSMNLLGEKNLDLNPGNRNVPAPSGFVIPRSRITPSTDLDQVLNVLGPDTRARLTILINEAGAALTGRRQDLSAVLAQLPSSLSVGASLFRQLISNDHSLASLVQHTDGFITALAVQRRQLGALVGTVAQSAQTVAVRDSQLQGTLRRLPGTLRTARTFLNDLSNTTVPLGPAARDIQQAAPPLESVLAQLTPFTQAARPALAAAGSAAPGLTSLAGGVTPVLRAAAPTLDALRTTSADLVPVSHALSLSVDNIVAVAANWAHAIQLRDGLSHVFRAEVTVTPATVQELVNRLLTTSAAVPPVTRRPAGPRPMPAATHAAGAAPVNAPPVPPSLGGVIKGLGGPVLRGVTGLLGAVGGTLHKVVGTLVPGAGVPAVGPTGLSSLLKYLLKP